MSNPVQDCLDIYQGATFRVPLVRMTIPYAAREECGRYVNAETGALVPPSDMHAEDYTGCSARMQMRVDVCGGPVLIELSTANGGIELAGDTMWLVLEVGQVADLFVAAKAAGVAHLIGHVEVTRPDGSVERQYELTFHLHCGGNQ